MWFLLALAVVPMAWLAGRWFLSMSRMRRWSAVGARALLFVAIAALLAGAVSVRRTDRLAVVAVIDVSESVRRFGDESVAVRQSRAAGAIDAARAALARATAERGAEDLLGVVVFDGRALAIATPTRADPLDRPLDVSMAAGTDIEAALRYASAMIPADAAGRIVLFSDGNETIGDAEHAAAELVARLSGASGGRSGVPIDVVPLWYDIEHEVIVETVDVPPTAEEESVVAVRVVLRSAGEAEGTLRLSRNGEEIDISPGAAGLGRALRLVAGRRVEVIEVPLERGRVHRFDAVWEPRILPAAGGGADGETGGTTMAGDTRVENNRAAGLTITPGQGEVLIVDGVGRGAPTGGGALLARTLRLAGIGVSAIDPAAMPEDLVSLQAYDLVILQDVPADAMSQRAQAALAAHVQELGAGLVMLGGYNSFAVGGWRGSAIEPLLPVDLEIPDELIVPSAAVMIVLDSSGSMGHNVMGSVRTQQEIANESAALAVSTLDKRDLVGVVSFDSRTREVVPLGPNTDPDATAARIRSISAGGGTVIGPALGLARDRLIAVDAEIKHVILLSDGQAADAEMLPAMAESLGRLGIRITTISVGAGADQETMKAVADMSGGEHHAVMNPSTLPRIFVRAIRVVRTPLVRESPFVPRVLGTGSPLVEGFEGAARVPALGGLSLTRARTDPTITTAMVTNQGEPVLAHWQVGLGQVAVFTSDARSDNWASMWAAWPGYAEFWIGLVRNLLRPTAAGPYELQMVREGDGLVLRLDAVEENGEPVNYLSVPATVYDDRGAAREVTLAQVAPGVYEARLDRPEPGQVVAVVRPRLGQEALPPVVGGTTIPAGAEFRRLRSDGALLEQLADITGGRMLDLSQPTAWGVFDRAGVPPRVTMTPVFVPLMLLALGLFVLDVATRRVAWDRFVSREFGVDLRKAAAEATRERGEEAGRTLAGLKAGRTDAADATSGRGTGEGARRGAGRGTPGSEQGSLGEQSAARVIAEARQRRAHEEAERLRKLREEMLGASGARGTTTNRGGTPRIPSEKEHDSQPKDGDSGTGGLLAAKRRAQERFEQTEDEI
ncbi:MAG: VWA domain-containing protein [Planctomycetota bacterium]|nr:VWA domain-containing protein [Planctomycetota bacterium]